VSITQGERASTRHQEEKDQEQQVVVREEIQDLDKVEVNSPLYHQHQEEVIFGQAMQKKVQVDIIQEEKEEEAVHPLLHLEDPLGAETHPHLHHLLHH
jgi:hypothetical protein